MFGGTLRRGGCGGFSGVMEYKALPSAVIL